MSVQKVILLYLRELSPLGHMVEVAFETDIVDSIEGALDLLQGSEYQVVVYDCMKVGVVDLSGARQLLQQGQMSNTPLVLLTDRYQVEDKLHALEIGCDDLIDTSVDKKEAITRIRKSIFNQIAQSQLKSRIDTANKTAHSALSDISDLGANIQFLLSVHECDNLDQLGQQLFHTLSRYGLRCSLQMRSSLGTKNMEAHGMAKDLESQLMAQLAGEGRFIDFGNRTIINYDRVSLLIKDMPVDDTDKYGSIKDNSFSLVQGLNARVIALEAQQKLVEEKERMKKISEDVGAVMVTIKESYQKVMCDIVNEVENVAEMIQSRLPTLALTEDNEKFLESATDRAIAETNRIFNDGLVVDEVFAKLESAIEKSMLEKVKEESDGPQLVDPKTENGASGIELF